MNANLDRILMSFIIHEDEDGEIQTRPNNLEKTILFQYPRDNAF